VRNGTADPRDFQTEATVHRDRKAAFTLIELLVVIAVMAILAAILFPVFAQVRDKARQAACFSNLRQIGSAMAIYVQDYDEHLPNCCATGRAWTWLWQTGDLMGRCAQAGITAKTPKDTFLGPEQTPPRYVQELLHPYVKNLGLWFCPSVGRERFFRGDRTLPTFGYNGTTYRWNSLADPTITTDPNPFRKSAPIEVSGRAIAAIPRPAEAPTVWDMPDWNPVKEPCTSMDLKPAHAKGVNVLYADTHVKFSPFVNRATRSSGEPNPCLENWFAENSWKGFFE
jgi:prepilin-type N-terminal cleavage/methylation domain-containing protein/prepilin-type processing-associated H-X9-DG protein